MNFNKKNKTKYSLEDIDNVEYKYYTKVKVSQCQVGCVNQFF